MEKHIEPAKTIIIMIILRNVIHKSM